MEAAAIEARERQFSKLLAEREIQPKAFSNKELAHSHHL